MNKPEQTRNNYKASGFSQLAAPDYITIAGDGGIADFINSIC